MRKAFYIPLLPFAFLLFTSKGIAQYYGVNLQPVCWQTSTFDSTIYVALLSAANTTKPTKIHYFKLTSGTPVAVTVTGGVVRPGPCGQAFPLPDSTDATNGKNTFASFTLNPNCCNKITIINQWLTTYDITVDGSSVRLEPGEAWYWDGDYLDPRTNIIYYNPQVIFPATAVSTTALRYYYELK